MEKIPAEYESAVRKAFESDGKVRYAWQGADGEWVSTIHRGMAPWTGEWYVVDATSTRCYIDDRTRAAEKIEKVVELLGDAQNLLSYETDDFAKTMRQSIKDARRHLADLPCSTVSNLTNNEL